MNSFQSAFQSEIFVQRPFNNYYHFSKFTYPKNKSFVPLRNLISNSCLPIQPYASVNKFESQLIRIISFRIWVQNKL